MVEYLRVFGHVGFFRHRGILPTSSGKEDFMHPIVFAPFFVVLAAVLVFLMGITVVRPTHRGLVERLGKYSRFADRGFNWIIACRPKASGFPALDQ